jgi:eukaryotic-like serine/threonine-protein kinase
MHSALRLLALVLTLSPSVALAQTMFCGNAAHTGVSASAGPKTLTQPAWTFKVGGAVVSSPAVDAERVYVGSDDRNVYALDRKSGRELWRFKTAGAVRSSPAVANGTVYFGSYDGFFYAVDAKTGQQLWRFETGGERRFEAVGLHGQKPAKQTMADVWDVYLSSPVVDDEAVYFGSGDHHVYALSRKDGAVRWKFETGGVVHSSPALAKGTLFVGSWDTFMYAIDAQTGKEKWRFKTGEDAAVHNQTGLQSSAALQDGVVYFGCRDAHLYAVDPESGQERWNFSIKPTWINATPAVYNGQVYFGSSIPTKFYAVDAKTGKESYSLDADFIVFGSAAIAGDRAYFGSFGGTLFAVDLSEKRVASSYVMSGRRENKRHIMNAEGKPDFGATGASEYFEDSFQMMKNIFTLGSVLGSPAVAEGVLYVGDGEGNVYAFE